MDQPIKIFFFIIRQNVSQLLWLAVVTVGYKCDALTETPQIRIEQPPAGQAYFDFLNVCNISRRQAIR